MGWQATDSGQPVPLTLNPAVLSLEGCHDQAVCHVRTGPLNRLNFFLFRAAVRVGEGR